MVVRVIRVVKCFNRTHPSIVAETEGFRTFLQGAARQSRGESKSIALELYFGINVKSNRFYPWLINIIFIYISPVAYCYQT